MASRCYIWLRTVQDLGRRSCSREVIYVLILLYPPQMQEANRRIQELREIYKHSFSQDSVLRVDSFSFVSF